MRSFDLQRLGQIMEPEAGDPMEVPGVLNPAAVRGPDFARLGIPEHLTPGAPADDEETKVWRPE